MFYLELSHEAKKLPARNIVHDKIKVCIVLKRAPKIDDKRMDNIHESLPFRAGVFNLFELDDLLLFQNLECIVFVIMLWSHKVDAPKRTSTKSSQHMKILQCERLPSLFDDIPSFIVVLAFVQVLIHQQHGCRRYRQIRAGWLYGLKRRQRRWMRNGKDYWTRCI